MWPAGKEERKGWEYRIPSVLSMYENLQKSQHIGNHTCAIPMYNLKGPFLSKYGTLHTT